MMDTKATATLDFAIPEDDGAIARALNDLERKLTAWSGAIADAHAGLERIAAERATAAQHAAVSPAPRRQDSAAAIAPRPKPVAEITEAPRAGVTEAPPPPAKAQKRARSEAAVVQPSPPAVADRADRISLDQEAGAADVENPMGATAELPQPDDKELLESLDEDTRRAVQLIRRLSPSKSLSELLEIHRASVGSTTESQNKKKSWWKRGTQ